MREQAHLGEEALCLNGLRRSGGWRKIVNLETARALGVTIPKVVLLRADETIQ